MSQDFQSIGSASPELETIANQHKGWTTGPLGDPTHFETTTDEATDAGDYSFWDKRANKQGLGLQLPNMAGYVEPPMAGITPVPAAQAEPDAY